MWKICRAVALQQLRRQSRNPVTIALVGSISQYATNNWQMSTISPRPDIEWHNQRNQARNTITQRIASITKSEMTDQDKQELVNMFAMTLKFHFYPTMIEVFDMMKRECPEVIDASMYDAVYLPLLMYRKGSVDQHNGQYLMDVYQTARPHFEPMIPEIIYRYGIVGSSQLKDIETAEALLDEMTHVAGLPVSNIVYSWIIGTFGHLGNTDKVMEYYTALLELKNQEWDPFTVFRIVKGLCQVNRLGKAFEFCQLAKQPLDAPILCAFLKQCSVSNNTELAVQVMEYYRESGSTRLDEKTLNNVSRWLHSLQLDHEADRIVADHTAIPSIQMDGSFDIERIDIEKEHSKVEALLAHWETEQSPVDLTVLNKIVLLHTHRGLRRRTDNARRDLAYRAAKLLHKHDQDQSVKQLNYFAQLFKEFKDTDESLAYCESVLESFREHLPDQNRKKWIVTVRKTVEITLETLIENNRLPQALTLVHTATDHGLQLTQVTFWKILASMSLFTKHVVNRSGHIVLNANRLNKPFLYIGEDFEQVLDEMDKRGMPASIVPLAHVCCALGGGTDAQRQRLLNLWKACVERDTDNPNTIAPYVYTALLQTASRAGDYEEASRIYMIAMSTVDASSAHANTAELWELLHVAVLAKSGNMTSAIRRLLAVASISNANDWKVSLATVKILCSAIKDPQHHSAIDEIMQLLEQHDSAVNSHNASYIIRLAKEKGLARVARSVLQLYERVEARDKGKQEKNEPNSVIQYRQAQVIAMYSDALELCAGEDETWDRVMRKKVEAMTVDTETVQDVVS